MAGIGPDILALAGPYSKALAWGTLPLLLYFAVRRCMQGMNMVRPIAFALVTANIINAIGNWILIYGKLGRSEEHTSELQSRLHLVCRLLLEKKKKIPASSVPATAHHYLPPL